MVPWLRALVTLAEGQNLVTHKANTFLYVTPVQADPLPPSGLLGYCMHAVHRHMQAKHPYT